MRLNRPTESIASTATETMSDTNSGRFSAMSIGGADPTTGSSSNPLNAASSQQPSGTTSGSNRNLRAYHSSFQAITVDPRKINTRNLNEDADYYSTQVIYGAGGSGESVLASIERMSKSKDQMVGTCSYVEEDEVDGNGNGDGGRSRSRKSKENNGKQRMVLKRRRRGAVDDRD